MQEKTFTSQRISLVTGAAHGIGRGIAEALARQGMVVVIADQNPARDTVEEITRQGGIAQAFQVDVTDSEQVNRFVEAAVTQFGRIDVLVNNAGASQNKNILEITEDDWNRILNTNLTSAFLCCKAVMPTMMQQGYGRIVNISSIVARRGALFGHVHYAASKAGLNGLTRTLALWAGPYGITVNSVAPGCIDTDLLHDMHTDQEISKVVSRTPVGRIGTPADVGELVAFLAREAAANITGCVIDTNGGAWIGP
jgi:NAD(P)-dependent dehydrogenase (short-subunit alcohol dehydrogenase family)